MEDSKKLSNRIALSATNAAICLISLIPAIAMLVFSFVGLNKGEAFIKVFGVTKYWSSAPLLILFILCSLGFLALWILNLLSVIKICGISNPEDQQKFLKKAFFSTVLFPSITVLLCLLAFVLNGGVGKFSIAYMLFNDKYGSLSFVILSLPVLALGWLGLHFLKKSQIVSVKVKKPLINTQAVTEITGDVVKGVSDTIGETACKGFEAMKDKAPEMKQQISSTCKDVFAKAKRVLLSPKNEWVAIAGDDTPHWKVFLSYLLPLALVPTIAAFIGYGLIGVWGQGIHISSTNYGFQWALTQFITMVGGAYLTALVINALSENFGARKDFNKAFALIAYAYTPVMAGGVFYIIPNISILAQLAGIYSLYLLYIGLQPMMKPIEEKKTAYFVVSLICLAAVYFVLEATLSAVIM